MDTETVNLIGQHCRPMDPIATDAAARLVSLPNVRAVLFDIYGTLLVSAIGEIGLSATELKAQSLQAAAAASGLTLSCDSEQAVAQVEQTIYNQHARAQAEGVEHPEVDIVDVWRRSLPKIVTQSTDGVSQLSCWEEGDWQRFSLEYELRINPVWPMPGVTETLDSLRNTNVRLGVVSNAQFFTPLLFPVLVGRSLGELGCQDGLVLFSYEHGRAKPGTYLFDLARRALQDQGISASQVLYVGNDMLNDVAAATQIGFRTALFAGDQRSLRWRADDTRVAGVEPTVVLTQLTQLLECLEGGSI